MDHGIPEGFIGLGDAYEHAFQYLEDKERIASALIKQWSLVEFATPEELASGVVPKTIGYRTDPKAQAAYDKARDRIEEIMRMALCRGVLVSFFRDSQSGDPLQPLERDGWERSSEIPGFGLQNTIDDTFCPGPAELVGRPVFLRTEQFQEWLNNQVRSGGPIAGEAAGPLSDEAKPQSAAAPRRIRGRPCGDDEQRNKEIQIVLKEAEREYPRSNKRHPSFSKMAEDLCASNGVKNTRFSQSSVAKILRGTYPKMIEAGIKSPHKK